MTEEQWKQLAFKDVIVSAGFKERLRLGERLGSGGAGAVYDMGKRHGCEWVIKVLAAPDSPVSEQELTSLNIYRGNFRYHNALMKFNSWSGILEYEGKTYSCYMMRKGRPLADAIEEQEDWLTDSENIIRLAAYLVHGIFALKNKGFSHGDIKADNILLVEHQNNFYPVFSDYGTVSDRKHQIRSNPYHCDDTEYASPLEERIAYDLHCLYMVFCRICGVEDIDVLPLTLNKKVFKLLKTMRSPEKKAFDRLNEIMNLLKEYCVDIPVAFYLDAIPTYELTEDFPFEKIMQWGEYAILRDKNTIPGTAFDPLLLLPIKSGHYEKVYKILIKHNKLRDFIMPIARYFDKNSNEYVLIHAPDDRNKCSRYNRDEDDERIQDDTAIPYTLKHARDYDKKWEKRNFLDILTDLKVNIEFSTQDIWHMDGRWKLNLFSAAFLEQAEKDAESCRILWK